MPRRIRRRETIPRDFPDVVLFLPEDEQFLVAFGAFPSRCVVGRRAGRIGARESPARTELDNLGDHELNVQRDRLEDRIVRFSDGCQRRRYVE